MSKALWFRQICLRNGFEVSDSQISLIERYVDYLLDWNQNLNLISRKDEENIWSRHILGSIGFLFRHEFEKGSRIVDVGSGGGLPGIPLAILLPGVNVLMVDSIHKKVNAVQDILQKLELPNASIVVGRAEDLSGTGSYRGKFNNVIARAVAPIADLLKWTSPFLIRESSPDWKPDSRLLPGGSVVLLKGGDLSDEIANARLKARPHAIHEAPIVIDGIDTYGGDLQEKKLIIILP